MKYQTSKKPKYLKKRKKKKVKNKSILLILSIAAVTVIALVGLLSLKRNPGTSVISKIVGAQSLDAADGRTNVLALGLDRRTKFSTASGTLTDTIIIGSIAEDGSNAAIISVPRDLWVPYGKTEYFGKINSIYAWGGVEAVSKTIERVFDIPIHYFTVAGFEGFVKAVDTVGGLEVDVERAFDDYKYPIEGKEDVLPEENRYTHLHFEAGKQTMAGDTALQFARSRHAQGEEGSDFARSSRQQKIVLAFKERIFSSSTIFNPSRVKLLYDIFKTYVETNVSLEESLAFFELSKKLDSGNIKSFILNDNLLYNPQDMEPYGGAWVLIPKAGDFSEVQRFIKELLSGTP